ncbi:F0F1 ATP synthase subunit delta [Nocardioides sp. AX2bis]|uniref:F0F1 ATP synthase subunit delta n=1 Tax=Nocardioides sp. AX2bis TaxID=2653157 RepID=UPI0012F30151|nr:F0F1 ATP synthase subunit delta [Nocardioides sp. AX2bis]VXB20992.1 ATP synthase subunit delta [Nocardioides sp. AX2bis]
MQFRGASSDSAAELVDQLAEQVRGEPGRAATMADDLVTVAATLRREGSLRRFLTDGSLPAEARTGLASEVFGSSVDSQSLELVTAGTARRWTSAGDLPTAFEHLAVVAAVRSAGDETERLADELFAVSQAVKQQHELRDALSDPVRDVAAKETLVRDVLGSRFLEATVRLVVQAVTSNYRTVTAALEEYQKVAARVHGERVATVRVAKELTDDEARRLEQALQRQYDRPVHLNQVVDPGVIGGVRVEIGDDVIDGTVSSRLAEARRRLAGTAG